MAQSSLPPRPPKGGSAPLTGAVIALLILGGGFGVWKWSQSDEPAKEVPVVQSEKPNEPELHVAPPPPPPPEETAAPAPAETAQAATSTDSRPSGNASGCGGPCDGTIDSAFRSALRQKGGLAKGCYDRALRQNSALQGKMTIAVRVSPNGNICSASAVSDSLGDPAVQSCILQKFRAGTYPRPRGGCVDAQVPLNFVAKP